MSRLTTNLVKEVIAIVFVCDIDVLFKILGTNGFNHHVMGFSHDIANIGRSCAM